MSAANPGLGAYVQAQKRQKQIEDQLAKAHPHGDGDDGKHGGGGEKKDSGKEQPQTVGGLAKTVAKEVIGVVKEVTKTENTNETMDGSVARIVTYSGKKMAEGLGGFSRWARGMGQKPLQLTTGQRGVRRVKHLWRDHGAPGLQQAKAGITFSFVVKLAVLWLLRRRVPKAGPFLELCSLAIPLGEVLARWRMPNYQWPSVPEPAARGLQLVRGLAAPLFVLDCVTLLHRLGARHGSNRQQSVPETPRRTRKLKSRTPRTPRTTPRRLTFKEDDAGSLVTPSGHLGGLTELPPRPPSTLRRTRSVGGTPRDRSTPRAMRTPRGSRTPRSIIIPEEASSPAQQQQPLSAASARLITSVLCFITFMLAMMQRWSFSGAGSPTVGRA